MFEYLKVFLIKVLLIIDELAVSHLETFALVNSYLIWLENLAEQGKNISLNAYGYRYALLDLARVWSKGCIAALQRKSRKGYANVVRNQVLDLKLLHCIN